MAVASLLLLSTAPEVDARGGGGGRGGGGFGRGGEFGDGGGASKGEWGVLGGRNEDRWGDGSMGGDASKGDWGSLGGRNEDRGWGGMGRDGGGWRNAGGDWRESTGAGGNWGTAGGRDASAASGLGTGVQSYGSLSHAATSPQKGDFGFDHVLPGGGNRSGMTRYSAANLADRGLNVRDNFNRYDNFYGRNWWNRYPGAWWPGRWGWGDAWGMSAWGGFGGYIGMDDDSEPDYYDYGGSITYNNNNVYYNTTPVATTTEYYTQAQTLAATGNNSTKTQEWKPLGVYSLVQGSQSDTSAMFQLAMDKQGDIGGNYYSVLSGQTLPVKGKLDKKNQRAAWTVGTNKEIVYDTGLGNLFKNQAPILVHFSKDKTEQWLLVRLQRPASGTAAGAQPASTGSAGTD
jgi:hypothetical protein